MQDVISVLGMFLPLIVIMWLASFADRQREKGQRDAGQVLSVVSYVFLVLLYLAFIAAGLLVQVLGIIAKGTLPPELARSYQQSGIDPSSLAAAMPQIGLGLWLPSVFGIILLLPPVRRLISRVIAIDPTRTVHAIAVSFPMLILVNLLVTLGIGLGNLASLMQSAANRTGPYNPAPGVWAQEILFALLAMVGVGMLSRRNLADVLRRLAIVVPRVGQIALGVVVGLGMVPLVLAIEYGAKRVGFGTGADVERLSQELVGPLAHSIPGILTLGLAAALGEETMFRGALQPRFGLILTAVLFALLHSTYGLSLSTLIVFLVGLVLGLVRRRSNTTTSMAVHAVYNMTLGLLTYLNVIQNL